MNTKQRQLRSTELAEFIKTQEALLEDGSKTLKVLNEDYNTLYREYKLLLLEKERLINDIASLTENLNIYSNL